MLRVELKDLARDGTLRLERRLGTDDPLWADTDLPLNGPVHVDLRVTQSPTGQVLATGSVDATLVQECRRCLTPVERATHLDLALVWSPPDELSEDDEDDGEIRTLEAGAGDLDVGAAVREELLLAAPRYVVCKDTCKGICPHCGADLNEGACECGPEEPDPRWAALRSLDER